MPPRSMASMSLAESYAWNGIPPLTLRLRKASLVFRRGEVMVNVQPARRRRLGRRRLRPGYGRSAETRQKLAPGDPH